MSNSVRRVSIRCALRTVGIIGLLLLPLCVRAALGDLGHYGLRWRRLLRAPLTSSPVVVGDSVYVGAPDGSLYCLSAKDGTTLWRFQTNGEVRADPLIVDDWIFIGSMDRYAYALDRRTGALRWKFKAQGAIQCSAVAYAKNILFGSGDGRLYAFQMETGTLRWKVKTRGSLLAPPIVNADRLYLPSYDGVLRAYAVNDGLLLWTFDTEAHIWGTPLLLKHRLFIGDGRGHLYALAASNGKLLYKLRLGGSIQASPVTDSTHVFIASTNHWIYALDPQDGHILWKRDTGSEVKGTIRTTPTGEVLVGGADGRLHIYDALSGEERGQIETGGALTSLPVRHGQDLYLSSGDGYLYAITIGDPASLVEGEPSPEGLLHDTWWEERYQGIKIGYRHEQIRTVFHEGETALEITGKEVDWENGFRRLLSKRIADTSYRLIAFEDRQIEGDQIVCTRGQVQNDTLSIETTMLFGAHSTHPSPARTILRRQVHLPSAVILPELLERAIAETEGFKVRETYTRDLFDYSTFRLVPTTLSVLRCDSLRLQNPMSPIFQRAEHEEQGEATGYSKFEIRNSKSWIPVYIVQIEQEGPWFLPQREWVDKEGNVLRVEIPDIRYTTTRVPKSQALSWHLPRIETMVLLDVDLPQPDRITALQIEANRAKDFDGHADLHRLFSIDARQKLITSDPGHIRLSIHQAPFDPARALPRPIFRKETLYLRPTVYLQSGDTAIVHLAHRIVRNEDNAWNAARRLLEWTYNNMTTMDTNVKFKSALEVLHTMEGTCSEYANLFITLCRAAGIPARASVGLYPTKDQRLILHMWAQVYVGRWIDVDPSYNQMTVDAAHIALGHGDVSVEAMGNLNMPLQLALSQLDTIHVIRFDFNGEQHLTEADRLLNQAAYAERTYRDAEALSLLQEAARLPFNSKTDDAVLNIGQMLARKGDLDSAQVYFQKVVDEYPSSNAAEDALFQLAKIYQDQGRLDRALPQFQRLLRGFPDGNLADDALYRIGEIYEKLGNYGAAQGVYRSLIEQYPSSVWLTAAQRGMEECEQKRRKALPRNDPRR